MSSRRCVGQRTPCPGFESATMRLRAGMLREENGKLDFGGCNGEGPPVRPPGQFVGWTSDWVETVSRVACTASRPRRMPRQSPLLPRFCTTKSKTRSSGGENFCTTKIRW
eukprot:2844363-Rhodomonas_salina.1